ncbi:MAG: hypothetical protein H7A09_01515 [Oceanospirillaceae bacterium]|nr:hypothetical protein [Oceanospirillaceae bacterium]MCP5351071.1 hypothetical protein [Oceanospirillaceae bacterium]
MNEAARIAYLGALGIDVWWPCEAFADEPHAVPEGAAVPACVAQAVQSAAGRPQSPVQAVAPQVNAQPAMPASLADAVPKSPAARISELQQSLQAPVVTEVPEFTLQFVCFRDVWLVFSRQDISPAHAMLLADIARWRGSEVARPTFMADFVWPYIRDGKIDQGAEQARRHLGMFMANLHQQQAAREVLVFADARDWLNNAELPAAVMHKLPVSLTACLNETSAKRALFHAFN